MPVPEWEIPEPTGDGWDYTPPETTISGVQKPVGKPLMHRLKNGRPSPAGVLSGRVFQGRLNVSDLDYMAKAILQMADENHELRERVRVLEDAERKRQGEA